MRNYNPHKHGAIKAKDSPWDAVLMGSVASTVNTNIRKANRKRLFISVFSLWPNSVPF